MSYNDIAIKAESVTRRMLMIADGVSQALIDAGGQEAGQRIYDGTNSVEKSAPCIVVSAGAGQEEPYDTGNYWLPINIEIKAAPRLAGDVPGDARSLFKGLVSAVCDALHQEELESAFNAAALTASIDSGPIDFSVQGWRDRNTGGQSAEGVWTQTVEITLYCSASSVA